MDRVIKLGQAHKCDSQSGYVYDRGGYHQLSLPEHTATQSDISLKVMCDLEVGGQRGRVFHPVGMIASLSATDYKDPPKVIVRNT